MSDNATFCRICLRPLTGDDFYHPECLTKLFGVPFVPELAYSHTELMRQATDMMGKMSISGIQEKVSLRLSPDESRLELATVGGQFILKPEPTRFAFLPQNEHLTMRLATLVGIEIPSCGLFSLQDGSLAFLIKRFDRLNDGEKLAVEDFCQLAEKPAQEKYSGSGELLVRMLRKHASEPEVEIHQLFKRLLFGWWVSNGDLHLKNFSMLTQPDGQRRLTPAYDMICTRLPIPSDVNLALTVGGKRDNLTRRTWLEFAAYCQLPKSEAEEIIALQIAAFDEALSLIHVSFMPSDLQADYENFAREKTELLRQAS